MDLGFALAVQQVPATTSKVLVLGQLAGYRNGDRWFGLADIEHVFEAFRIPEPDVRRALRQLVNTAMVRRARVGERWSLTPEGEHRVRELFGDLDLPQLEAQLALVAGAEFGHARHALIPPTLAPVKWAVGIEAFLERFPFETNVFCMTRFPSDEAEKLPDPVREVINLLRDVLRRHGLAAHLASDRQIADDLWGNVAAHAWACQYGLGLFEDRMGEGINNNLIIEIGSMLMTGRRCALLKDKTVEKMPTDLVGRIYKPVDFDDRPAVEGELHNWCTEDLGLSRCETCP